MGGGGEFRGDLNNYQLLKKDSAPWVYSVIRSVSKGKVVTVLK